MDRKDYGDFGEKKAVKFLKNRGYKILQKNYKAHSGEADIIVLEGRLAKKRRGDYKKMSSILRHDKVVVFVEVKSRNSVAFGNPSDAVDNNKQEKYIKIAREFLKTNKKFSSYQYRFDIIEVFGDTSINHIINAF